MKNDFELFLLYHYSLIPIVYCHDEIYQLQNDYSIYKFKETRPDTSPTLDNYNKEILILVSIIQMS